mgnify:FL=1|jgi:hypothetical protein|tara:strand:- start:197 stop:496 length:300 start_codon:yes stop_codon:yes gene_type:complete
MNKIGEDTNVTLDLKTIGMIVGFTVSLATTYFTLKSDIALAMELPEAEVSKIEFSYKDELTRKTLENAINDMNTIKDDVKEIKEHLNKMDERLYEISKK